MTENTLRPAGFLRRITASLVDFIILLAAYMTLLRLVPILRYPNEMAFSVNLMLFLAYFVGFTRSRWGATPGKILLGLLIVDDQSAQPLSNKRTILRALWLLVPFIPALCVYYVFYPYNLREHTEDRAGSFVLQQKINAGEILTPEEQVHWRIFEEEVQKPITHLWLMSLKISVAALGIWTITMFTNRRRQAPHDIVCNSMVTYKHPTS